MNDSAPRGRRNRSAEPAAESGPAYVTRRIPYYAFLDEEALARIERQAFHLLETVGIEFREAPDALQRWRDAGASVVIGLPSRRKRC
jgi:trimethylamine--corrinoid protein Co-methyltransferase